MIFGNRLGAVAVFMVLGMFGSAGLAIAGNPIEDIFNKVKSDFAAINAQGERDRAAIRARGQDDGGGPVGDFATVAREDESSSTPTQLIIPKDKKVAAAVEAALPVIKKVVSIHQCLKNNSGLREMNFFAVPGEDMSRFGNPYDVTIALPIRGMKYHDKNKCPRIQAIDQFSMPALNALLFRTVYFADDSGETASFLYLFMKVDDGSWKIKKFEEKYAN